MITIYVKQGCGCCTTEMQFQSVEAAQQAFAAVGLTSSGVIVDDAGERHEGVDTFYGFSTSEDEQDGRSLGYLVDRLTGSRE
jgi:hypothetical protein